MKQRAISSLVAGISILMLSIGNIPADETVGSLIVAMEGFSDSRGYAMVAVYGSEEAYKAGTPRAGQAKAEIADKKALAVIDGLAYGTYAVAIYHDQNANGKMDKNFLGIPKEAYGHSNNARGSMGPPSFEDAKIDLAVPEMTISINMGK
jgi:uncharacterized protein (DUF2141 family)